MSSSPRPSSPVAAEAIFGSTARGDKDGLSDRDILIVDDSYGALRRRKLELEASGWSVAPYTFKRLGTLAERGSLFIQHLKAEAVILNDSGLRLAKLLDSYRPNSSYFPELLQNRALTGLLGGIPQGHIGALFAADLLYVVTRNFGVLRLANDGIYLFSYGDVVEALESLGAISTGTAENLYALRELKCSYRNGCFESGERAADKVLSALDGLPCDWFPKKIISKNAFEVLYEKVPEVGSVPYLVLRDLERRYVALRELGLGEETEQKLPQLRAWIRDPRSYSGLAPRLAPSLYKDLQLIPLLTLSQDKSLKYCA